MPINPNLKHLYPDNWNEISKRIRFERANGRCENCGAEHLQPHPVNGKKTILTVAHLDHNPANNAEDNLKCLCARCHLQYDKAHHAKNARRTWRNKRNAITGQIELWSESE
jgi:hypothetical protein